MSTPAKDSDKVPVNILLVDDDPGKLLTYEVVLSELGENLIQVNSGERALDQLLRLDIAVVLVDVCMPGLDGFELASMIRAHPRFRKTAIILVSGILVGDLDRLRGYDSGAVDYLSVPLIPEILRAKVAVFVDLYRKTVELETLNQHLESRVAERTAEITANAARLRENEARLRLALSAAGIEAWSWDLESNALRWMASPESSQGTSLPLPEYLASVFEDDREKVHSALNNAVKGDGEYSTDFRIAEPMGVRWWLARGTVMKDEAGTPLSMAGIHLDITDRKRAEEERICLLANAEEARRESERANRLKDEFLATLSHELRTPLNAISGWVHLLRSGALSAEDIATAIETIDRNAHLQARLISDLLDISRIVSGKMRLEIAPVHLRFVVQSVLDTIRPTADSRKISIEAHWGAELPPLPGDSARLHQIVWNLLANAVKFTPANGRVEVRLESDGKQLLLTVRDSGPGIPAHMLPYIFERFRQGDASSTRAHQGLGLGLAIVRHLLDLHGGWVRATNRTDGTGAILCVGLPLAAPGRVALSETPSPDSVLPRKEAQSTADYSLTGVRVLVVDDEPDAREVAARILELDGAEVMVAGSASEAFGILQRERPDVIVADIEMPGEDGYGLVRRIRALEADAGGRTPVIALTAYAGAQDQSRLLAAGFHRHVPKPMRPHELLAAVAQLAPRSSQKTDKARTRVVGR